MSTEKDRDQREDGIDDREKIRDVNFKVFMAETVIYRKEQGNRLDRLSSKIDMMLEKMSMLPCRERTALWSSMANQMKFLWGIVVLIIAAIVKKFIE